MLLWRREAAIGLIMSGLLACAVGAAHAQSGPDGQGGGQGGAGSQSLGGTASASAPDRGPAGTPQGAPAGSDGAMSQLGDGAGSGLSQPGDKPVVVELFTSQGCSYCPPADSFLTMLSERDDVIALALHVDYWDYIGWEDTFGSHAFTRRQKSYAREAGRRAVYTPQMIIGGVDEVMGNHPMDVADLIRAHRNTPYMASLRIARQDGTTLRLQARPVDGKPLGPVEVVLVRYMPQQSVKVKRGENAGKMLTYSNIVTEWKVVGEWDGTSTLDETLPLEGEAPVVVLMQKAGPGQIVAAARLR